MRHRNKNKKLDRKKAPREAMLKNLAGSIIIHKKIKTTLAKAKVIRPVVEKLITVGKTGNLNARRKILSAVPQDEAAKIAIIELGKKYKDRPGGYVRIIKLGNRSGDGAQMAQIELV